MKVGRLVQTLEYFDVIPLCSWWRRLRGIQPPETTGVGQVGVILLIAKVADVTPETFRKLLEKSTKVRWLFPESERDAVTLTIASDLRVEAVPIDINNANLNPNTLTDVSAIIYVSNPVLNSIISDLIALSDRYLQPTTEKTIFDFTQPLEISNIWGAIDDVVMGGVSDSSIRITEGAALFSGNVSVANSGGFASVRTRNLEPRLDLSNYQGVELKVKGDGQRYKLFIRTNTTWDSLAYSYSFDTAYNAWLNVQIPFDKMVAVFRAKSVPTAPPIDLKEICAFQIMLSKFEYDGLLNPQFNPGNFSLEIASIKAYGGNKSPQFILVKNSDTLSVEAMLQRSNMAYQSIPSLDIDLLSL